MLSAVGYSLRHLADFRGRDRRATFWVYILTVQVFLVVITFATFLAAPVLNLSFSSLAVFVGATIICDLFLMAGSVVRRLHDRSLPGWIAIIPAAIHLGFVVPPLFASPEFPSEAELAAGVPLYKTLLDWLPYIMLMIIGVLPSTSGPNRYGEGSR